MFTHLCAVTVYACSPFVHTIIIYTHILRKFNCSYNVYTSLCSHRLCMQSVCAHNNYLHASAYNVYTSLCSHRLCMQSVCAHNYYLYAKVPLCIQCLHVFVQSLFMYAVPSYIQLCSWSGYGTSRNTETAQRFLAFRAPKLGLMSSCRTSWLITCGT